MAADAFDGSADDRPPWLPSWVRSASAPTPPVGAAWRRVAAG